MGLYDRPYLQDDSSRAGNWPGARTMVLNLILINSALWIADAFTSDHQITRFLTLSSDVIRRPWDLWQLLSYGFVHSSEISHVLFNMIGLWFFGSEVESLYGRMEFLRLYLLAIVVAGLTWLIITVATLGPGEEARLVGASGGVMAVIALFVFNFPKRTILIWGILPAPAWALGMFFVFMDISGYMHPNGSNVANVAHLGGFAFGALYFKTGLNLGRFVPGNWPPKFKSPLRPKLRIHEPREEVVDDLTEQVDAILEKISRQGEASLSKKERRTLEEASKRYQKKRQ
jgi:membrane associated rhomboid family serine protease